jgi:hypothetical protein
MLNQYIILQPYLLANGFIPYKHIEDPRTPLLPEILSWLLPLFRGNAVETAQSFHLFVVGCTVSMVLFWIYKTKGEWAMIAGGIYFIAWAHSLGYWATAYYDVVLGPLFFIIFTLMVNIEIKSRLWKPLLIGLLTSIGFLIKQQALFLIFIFLYWLTKSFIKSRKKIHFQFYTFFYYIIGILIPLFSYGIYYFFIGGDFRELLYWTVTYIFSSSYKTTARLYPSASHIMQILPAFLLLIPYFMSFFIPNDREITPSKDTRLLLFVFCLVSLILLFPRYSTRHFATSLPFLVTISGITCADIIDVVHIKFTKSYRWSVYALFVIWWTLIAVFSYVPQIINRPSINFTEYSNLIPLAQTLRGKIPNKGGLVILPVDESVGNLYYILQKLPPHYYVDFYPWFIYPKTINRWIRVMDNEKPRTMIFFKDGFDLMTYSPEILDYINRYYVIVDTVIWEGREVQVMTRQAGY